MYKQYTTPDNLFVLNFDFTIPEHHDARFISRFVDSIPDCEFPSSLISTGRPAHHPRMLLKMILFAYSRSVFSGRKIVQMNEEVLPMRWLTQDHYVCYRSINDFRVDPATSLLIQKAFIYFVTLLKEQNLIKDQALFIDGTKVEADANKYSFVWKKSIERYDARLTEKIKELYEELIERKVAMAMVEDELDTSTALEQMIEATQVRLDDLNTAIEAEPKVLKGGSVNKQERRTIMKHLRTLRKEFLPRKKKYEEAKATFQGRNSFSRTDPGATFMCLKEDPMKNRELKPAYNLQIATNQQFVMAYDIFPNPTDTRTLCPFLNSIFTLDLFTTIVADAGYGGEENYRYVTDVLKKQALIPYAMYRKEQKQEYQNDPTIRQHWTYHEDMDLYLDHHGVQFSFRYFEQRIDKYGFEREFKVYEADKGQTSPELEALAITPKGDYRTISVNYMWESYKHEASAALKSEAGSQLYAQRKTDVETVFGRMKRNFGVRRVHVRGEEGVRNDLGLLLLSMNLSKLCQMIRNQGLERALFGAIFLFMHKNIKFHEPFSWNLMFF